MLKLSKFTLLIFIFISTAILALLARKEALFLHRDPEVLINRYYLLRDTDPKAAQNALLILLQQDKNHIQALQELSQIYIREHHIDLALPLATQLHLLVPQNEEYMLQLALLYYSNGQWDQADTLLNALTKGPSWTYKIKAQEVLTQMASSLPYYQNNAIALHNNSTQDQSQVITILLNYYYQLKKEQPHKAEQLLDLLDTLTNDNALIPLESGYTSLQEKHQQHAIDHFLKAYEIKPNAELALQLAYLYAGAKQEQKAASFFLAATLTTDNKIKEEAKKGYMVVTHNAPTSIPANTTKSSAESLLMDNFYLIKKNNQEAAWTLIQNIITRYPNNLTALKEGGFLAIDLNHRNKAIVYFTKAYELSFEPNIALQLGYLYNEPNGLKIVNTDKYWAYHYFNLATHTSDKPLELKAQNAMTNLSGLQTKVLPDPYFSEIFFTPFTQSRFGLTVRPFIGRLGIEHNNALQSKTYFVLRRTQDNKSLNAGQVPQIYEDNVQILGIGEQITPIPLVPLIGFVEVGRAYDLIYRNRNRWRNDVRGGLMYYNEFGAMPAYFDHAVANAHYYSTLYGDVTYFSRYNNNVIATGRTHQGIRLWQYHSSMINLYATGRIIEDTNRDFFNNIAEIGPGIGFIPSNRYKVELRFEHVNGVYLPVRNNTNPYGKYYINNTVQLLFYTKL